MRSFKPLVAFPLLLPLIFQPHIHAVSSVANTVQPFLIAQTKPTPNFDVEVLQPLQAAQKAQADKVAAEAAEAARQAEIARQAYLNSVAGRVRPTGTYGNNYNWGNCTQYVASKISVPDSLGNANNWGFVLGAKATPIVGAIAWSTAGWAGHVAVVEAVSGDQVEVSEENVFGLGVVDTRWTNLLDWNGFIY